MSSMNLSLADGWTQVEPMETGFELLISGQSPGQCLISTDTAFRHKQEIGFSGGSNCPIAVDETTRRVFVSVDGIVSYELHGSAEEESKISENASPVWMLSHNPKGPDLLMHLRGEEPMQSFIARLNLENGSIQRLQLPEGAFVPLALSGTCEKVLYSNRQGAAVYHLANEVSTLASIELSPWVLGGAFDTDERRIILGGDGLWGWDTVSGSTSRLCEHGKYPAIDGKGDVWFDLKDGVLAKLNSKNGSFEVIVELSGLDTSSGKCGSYAQPVVFSPDARYGLARLTGREKLTGKDLEEAKAFCNSVGQPFSETHQYRYEHYFCVLDLELQQAWCSEGYAHNIAWLNSDI
ncbi:hypothetical protein RIdsm_01725 [Roseovarius indicus]|uniref:Uncharacterized protein n=1 Tax=Roseovarius indicus TaxID=540747 RepID=A0A5P3AB67_9RHOB|nr:hypothetical protein [Roseovarius indicus]QEW25933.1 hypothetical protein RIdsm_01725 [Roseovarius indicus]SFD90544.1 hypothetical protein SAMN04488031_103138 [Roseovarius indicus]